MSDFPDLPVPASPPLRVLLVDDHSLLLEGLTNLLEAHSIQVVGTARDGLEAIALAKTTNPDVILMDILMPRCDGLEATRRIKAIKPQLKIIILTTSTEEQNLFEAVKSGALGYLLKSIDADELIDCLKQAQQDIPPFSSGLAAKLLDEFARIAEIADESEKRHQKSAIELKPADRLTLRQREVLSLIAKGFSYKEAGHQLGLSPRTIKYHMAEIIQQLHLENRAQVLAFAGRAGIGDQVQKD